MRINKYLADCGVASRRKCDELIAEGKVKINGVVAKIGDNVEIDDNVVCNGKKVSLNNKYEYYMMNKPKGYVCTVNDDKGRKTVMDLMPKNIKRMYPVGRLDYDSEGLLILTNDGDLTFKLTHPINEIPKTYSVKIEGKIEESELNKLRNGVYIDGKKLKKCKIDVITSDKTTTKLSITIFEGRNREIRKMFESIGKPVSFLKRTKIGELKLSGLNRGEVRKLAPDEIYYLLHI